MAHLEDERLAQEAHSDDRFYGGARVARCPDCGAWVMIRVRDEINHGKLRGVCRCLCGLVWEVELAA